MTIVDDSLAQINRKERSVQLGASRASLRYDALLLRRRFGGPRA